MVHDWPKREWGDVATLEYGKALRGYQEADGPYRVYGTNGPIGRHDEPLCPHAGVIIGRKGVYRGVHYSSEPFFVIDTAFYLEPKEQIDLRWAYYCLLTYDINSMDSGSAIPSTSRGAFYSLPVHIPPIEEQQAIAYILGTLDDKIELNRRMNQTLEATARAIFKSWFVDFDPARAKAVGEQPPSLAPHIADLFPDAFEESELGEIPKGWKVASLNTVATLKKESVKPMQAPTRPWEHYSIPAFDAGQVAAIEAGETIKSTKYRVPSNSVLASKLNPRFPRVWLPDVQDTAAAICSTEFMPFVPLHDTWRPFLYELMKSDVVQRGIQERVTGSTGSRQRAKPEDVAAMPIVVPSPELIETFSRTCAPLHAKMHNCIRESRILAELRDTLLPQLMSGQIRVSGDRTPSGELL